MQQTVTRGTTAFRSRANLVAQQDTEINIGSIRLPQEAKPNSLVDASVTVENGYQIIFPTDPNYCETAFLRRIGHSITMKAFVDGREHDRQTKCVPGGGLSEDFSLTIQTPNLAEGETDTITVRYEAEFAATDETADVIERSITVSSEAEPPSEECANDTDCGPGKKCVDGKCVEGDGGPELGGFFTQVGIVLLLLIIVIAAVGD